MLFVVRNGGIPHHGHHVGENNTRPLILVGIYEHAQTLELVCGAEDWASCTPLLGEPDGHAVTVEVALAMNLEFNFDLRLVQL